MDEVTVALGPAVLPPVYQLSSSPYILKMFGGDVRTTSFTIKNLGAGDPLTISTPVFGDARFTLLSPSLPLDIAAGDSQVFVVQADMTSTTGAQSIATTSGLTTNDSTAPSPLLPLQVQIIPSGSRVLIDYDDGTANGVHESSVRNGGFEQGTAGDDFVTTPSWTSLNSPSGDTVQLTYDTDPATDLLRGVASGFNTSGGTLTTGIPSQLFSQDDWSLEEGDSFTISVTWKDGVNFVPGERLQVIVQILDENGVGVGDAANAEDPNANRMVSRQLNLITPGAYQTNVIISKKIQSGSPWIGKRPKIQFVKNGLADSFAEVDNISMVGQMNIDEINLSYYDFNSTTKEVTLRWNDIGGTFRIQGTDDLDFSNGVTEIPVNGANGTVDLLTYPGEIQFQFTDPAATGMKYFWRVATD